MFHPLGQPTRFTSSASVASASALIVAALAAYHNSLVAPFAFDDASAIIQNPTIRHLWPIFDPLSPPTNAGGVCGRPLVNFSFAINHAISGTNVWSYHALNIAIHVLAGLTLLGVARRTLSQPRLKMRFGATASVLSLAIAGLWILHPLQTESVTFTVQRNESLMGLFYLLTLYAFIRGTEKNNSLPWLSLAVIACLFGMACKEVMVSAPLMVLLYDRTFVAESFRAAWRQRGKFYATLGATWLLLVWLMTGSHQRGGTVGFGLGVTPWSYALTQCQAIVRYLGLSIWPHPLVVDYGTGVATSPAAVLPEGLLVLALIGGTIFALWRWPVVGFMGTWFFAILAPSSSVVPLVTQTTAEHRMYLPLVAVVALLVTSIHACLGQKSPGIFVALALGATLLTERRNDDYHDAVRLWSTTVASRPTNPRAHYNLGLSLLQAHQLSAAREQFEAALKIRPEFADAHNNLGNTLWALGHAPEAVPHYEEALRLNAHSAEANNNVGNARLMAGQTNEAIVRYEEALRLDPAYVEARNNLGYAFLLRGDAAGAAAQFEAVLRVKPDSPETHNNLGEAQLQLGRRTEAARQFERALELKPDYPAARRNLERTR